MNILYLAHRIPYPPDKGDKIRSFHQIRHLCVNHDVTCACFVDDPRDMKHVSALRQFCSEVIAIPMRRSTSLMRGTAGMLSGRTLTESTYENALMRERLSTISQKQEFDSIVAFSSGIAPYALAIPTARRVLDLCDLDSCKWFDYAAASRGPLKFLYNVEGRRLAQQEKQWSGQFDATILISETEAVPLIDQVGRQRIHCIGNGVPIPENVGIKSHSEPVVGFVGMMNYRPNVDAVCWFVEKCWNDIVNAHPSATFRIVGRSPTRKVRALATIPGVVVTGAVDDVVPELCDMDVSVAPMRIARGLQNKVLEAMAMATPVVLTSGAAQGISGQHDRDFLITDSPRSMAQSVINLLDDPAQRMRIGDAARRFVARYHRWEDVLTEFEFVVTGTTQKSLNASTVKDRTSSVAAHPSPVSNSRHT